MILITSYNSKSKKLCNYCSENIPCNLMVVREFTPNDKIVIPPLTKPDYSVPSGLPKRPMVTSESCSSIPPNNNSDLSIPVVNRKSPDLSKLNNNNNISEQHQPSTTVIYATGKRPSISKSMDSINLNQQKQEPTILQSNSEEFDNSSSSEEDDDEINTHHHNHHNNNRNEFENYHLISTPVEVHKEAPTKAFPQKSHEYVTSQN
ncbi:hypothetical protein CYY_005474 [Polysphondylium violaceum]|uniref:Uncharacterized protein n=1 Tax=Polysphondylium violaceum TaxID=133409 RepID=A0A8J4PSW0_9MYCE|nr:hypothetical protein CYY_005474 [Polysphondylium violaceum]